MRPGASFSILAAVNIIMLQTKCGLAVSLYQCLAARLCSDLIPSDSHTIHAATSPDHTLHINK